MWMALVPRSKRGVSAYLSRDENMSVFSQLEDCLIYLGMPAVTCYHLLCSNVFLNTAAEDARGLEKIGDIALRPFRYLFVGNTAALIEEGKYDIRQHFDY